MAVVNALTSRALMLDLVIGILFPASELPGDSDVPGETRSGLLLLWGAAGLEFTFSSIMDSRFGRLAAPSFLPQIQASPAQFLAENAVVSEIDAALHAYFIGFGIMVDDAEGQTIQQVGDLP